MKPDFFQLWIVDGGMPVSAAALRAPPSFSMTSSAMLIPHNRAEIPHTSSGIFTQTSCELVAHN
jgi:hypothetical protein